MPFGNIAAPGCRHHPAVIAQAAATLQGMFPDRLGVDRIFVHNVGCNQDASIDMAARKLVATTGGK